jgi:hypothetical protein
MHGAEINQGTSQGLHYIRLPLNTNQQEFCKNALKSHEFSNHNGRRIGRSGKENIAFVYMVSSEPFLFENTLNE